MKPSWVLKTARAKIEKRGAWVQGYPRDDGENCSITAMYRQTTFDSSREKAVYFLREAIGVHSVVEWNDAPNRTHAEVVDAFTRAIALAEQAGE